MITDYPRFVSQEYKSELWQINIKRYFLTNGFVSPDAGAMDSFVHKMTCSNWHLIVFYEANKDINLTP